MAWQAEQDTRCAGCGHPLGETLDPASEDKYRAEKLICHACAPVDRAKADQRENEHDEGHGARWVAERIHDHL